jgi:hypothetical protein
VKASCTVLNGGDGETVNTALCPYPTRDALNIALCAVEELGEEPADGVLRRPLGPGLRLGA